MTDNRAQCEALCEALYKELREAAEQPPGLTFGRFMELALYGPGGYYEQRVHIGSGGDFFTAAQSPLFGAVLANFVASTHQAWGNPPRLQVVEWGAGQGELAENLCTELMRAMDVGVSLVYTIMERSEHLRAVQEKRLQRLQSDRCVFRWGTPQPGVPTFVVANEVLDALPVERVRRSLQSPNGWEQAVVQLNEGGARFAWREADSAVANVARRWLPIADGTYGEVCLGYDAFFQQMAMCGPPLTAVLVDYGITSAEWASGIRPDGTLRAYAKHQLADVLAKPGMQDLTADVNWDHAADAARAAGLTVVPLQTQGKFLVDHGIVQTYEARAASERQREDGTSPSTRRSLQQAAWAGELKQLVLPGGMGERFQVMICHRTE